MVTNAEYYASLDPGGGAPVNYETGETLNPNPKPSTQPQPAPSQPDFTRQQTEAQREQELREALANADRNRQAVVESGGDINAYERSVKDVEAKVAAIDEAKRSGENMDPATHAAVFGAVSPWVDLASGTVDIQGALNAGLSDDEIRKAGVSQMAIVNTRRQIQQADKWEKINKQVSDYYAQKQAEFEANNVKLGDGKYISKQDLADIEKADPKYAEVGRTQGFDAMVAAINKDLGDYTPPPTPAEIKSAQQAYFDKKGWDFQDKTDPKYADRLMEATRDYSDSIGYTVPKAQIDAETRAERIGTIKESVMQLVPFEYLRSNRWGTLATWEKVVYPIMDVATLIPVVGWAGRGASAALKAGSIGAKVASLGGKEAVDLALKDATASLEKAAEDSLRKQILRQQVENSLKAATEAGSKVEILKYQGALKAAVKDATLAQKELTQIRQDVETLQKLAKAASKIPAYAGGVVTPSNLSAGAKAYSTAAAISRVGEATAKVGRLKTTVGKAADIAGGGIGAAIVSQATIRNWNELSPAQRVAGIGMAALSLGIVAPTVKGVINAGENVANPWKVPDSVVKNRRTNAIQKVGEIWAEEGGKTGGTTRLIIDETLGPEKAREAMATALREQHATGADVVVHYGAHQTVMKGTGFQGIVGGNASFSATPMGDIFKVGTGASGKKTLLEQYLEKLNQGVPEANRIEIEATPYGVKTVSKPGVTIVGKEGGQYVGQTAYTKFSLASAFGGKGNMRSVLVIFDDGISPLPKRLSEMDIKDMEKAAKKVFDGAHNVGETVEGFKQYKRFIEAENVITNGTQEFHIKSLRDKLADKLKQNKGNYFSRDKQGQYELLLMYTEGGRAVPLTLKEIYALKGRALRNALEDLAYGLDEKLKALKKAPKRTAMVTVIDEPKLTSALKEAKAAGIDTAEVEKLAMSGNIDGAVGKIDAAAEGKSLAKAEIDRLKAGISKSRKTSRIPSPEEVDLVTKEEQVSDAFNKLDDAYRSGHITAEELAEKKRMVVDAYRYASIPPSRMSTAERVMAQRLVRTAAKNLNRRGYQTLEQEAVRVPSRVEEVRATRSEPPRAEVARAEPARVEPAPRSETPRAENEPRVDRSEAPREPGTRAPEPPRTETPPRATEPPRDNTNPRITDRTNRTNRTDRNGGDHQTEQPPERTPTLSKERPTPAQLKNADAWPQGMGWWIVFQGDDGQLYRYYHYGERPPRGIKTVRQGLGEARRGIQRFRGRVGQPYIMPMGAYDVEVANPTSHPGKAGAISFDRTRPLPGERRSYPITDSRPLPTTKRKYPPR